MNQRHVVVLLRTIASAGRKLTEDANRLADRIEANMVPPFIVEDVPSHDRASHYRRLRGGRQVLVKATWVAPHQRRRAG